MKNLFAFCVIAVGFLAVRAAPSEGLLSKVLKIRETVRNTLDEIETIAIEDNPEVGANIKEALEEQASKARALLKSARSFENPTMEDAKGLIKNFLMILSDTKETVKEDVSKLSPEAQEAIVTKFKTSMASIREQVQDAKKEIE